VNKSPESQSPKLKAIRSRWLACTQSTGRVGKSTAAEGIITWLRHAGVDALVPRACGPGRLHARVDHVPDHSVFDGLGAACHRLVTVWWARSCNPRRTAVLVRGSPLESAYRVLVILMESFRKLIECLNGRLVDRVEKLSEKLNEIISAKRG
jgi:hypothetical protein